MYQQQAKDISVEKLPAGYKPLNKYFHAQFSLQPEARSFVPGKEAFDAILKPRYIVSFENNFKDLQLICHSTCGDVDEETRRLKERMTKHGLMHDWGRVDQFIDDSPEPKWVTPLVIDVGPKTQEETDDGGEEKKEKEGKAEKRINDSSEGKEE
ncbi:hypothetical protein NW768_008442 [Fusarium equiseti]|uniref:Uncharacterized protein n=1 Tax=Fusarium equiseti TaxID=61235 RepID=A0ABQ8R7B2_FUSEQ|nr:hypothetical protein NW768_008442 [Fusarium equiseti]